MKCKAIIFDLDGTLTDTLRDLCESTNYALRHMEWPERTMDEVRQFVGNGVRRLMEQAVPSDCEEWEFDECFRVFQDYYIDHCQDHTDLYPGIAELLAELKRRGYRMAIVSNKMQPGVDELRDAFFKDTISVTIGERPGLRRKPFPDMVEMALKALDVDASEAIYVGDSEVDMATARNAGLPCISVLWGFRDRDYLREIGAFRMIESPEELIGVIENDD
ncbi:MAG: HAD-IIIA family hydrolase [Bacteroidales bacterium]|nr:HAD-IIIA family hydrolase [Candidatus Physcousia equi]